MRKLKRSAVKEIVAKHRKFKAIDNTTESTEEKIESLN